MRQIGEGALDPYFEGKQFVISMSNDAGCGWLGYFSYGEDGSLEIDEFLPNLGEHLEADGNTYCMLADMEVLPDGRLVLADYDYGNPISGERSAVHLIEYTG